MGEEQKSMLGKLNRKKWGIIGAVILILIVLIVGISIHNSPANRLSRQLDLGNRYLEEQNYEQAIVEFDKAIVIDPMSVEAYLGKADAYIGLGDLQSALDTLQTGYDLTGDERLKEKLDEIEVQLMQIRQAEEEARLAVEEEVGAQGEQVQLNQVGQPEDAAQSAEEVEEQEDVELSFSVSDTSIMEYSLLDAHIFDEVVTAMGCTEENLQYTSPVSDHSTYRSNNGSKWISRYDNYYIFEYDVGGRIRYTVHPDRDMIELEVSKSLRHRDEFEAICNVPVYGGDTYDEWCDKFGVEAIKSSFKVQSSIEDETKWSDAQQRILTEDGWYISTYEERIYEKNFYTEIILRNESRSELVIRTHIEDGIIENITYLYLIK